MAKPKRRVVATHTDELNPARGQDSISFVQSMQSHFYHTGSYRTADLNRLLGDPRDAVGVSVDDGVKIFSLTSK